jgi:hypothetical protein
MISDTHLDQFWGQVTRAHARSASDESKFDPTANGYTGIRQQA